MAISHVCIVAADVSQLTLSSIGFQLPQYRKRLGSDSRSLLWACAPTTRIKNIKQVGASLIASILRERRNNLL
jgi:hypothetical protein